MKTENKDFRKTKHRQCLFRGILRKYSLSEKSKIKTASYRLEIKKKFVFNGVLYFSGFQETTLKSSSEWFSRENI